MPRYEVLTEMLGGAENCWTTTEEDGTEKPTTFESIEAAEAAITEYLEDCRESFEAGDTMDVPCREDFIVDELPEGTTIEDAERLLGLADQFLEDWEQDAAEGGDSGDKATVKERRAEWDALRPVLAASPKLLSIAQSALDRLTDLGIDLEGEAELIIASIRLDLHDAIEATKANA